MLKEVKGELKWIKTSRDRPEEFTDPSGKVKKTWSVTVYPDKESLETVRDMQASGIKNVVKKDEQGWFVKFSRPCVKEKNGKVVQVLDPPIVVDANGTIVDGFVNNGAIGTVKIDFTEGKTSKGKYYTARLEGIRLQDYKLWEGTAGNSSVASPKQENYF